MGNIVNHGAFGIKRDGMPDEWEKSQGLNSLNPGDGSDCSLDKKFTNLEVYLNSLVASVSDKK